MNIALVAGELSGDILGAGLIAALRERFPQASFQGVGGQGMISQGLDSLVPLERLSVMGLVEVLRHLPDLMSIRRRLSRALIANRPDIYIGIDAPDFNLGLEYRLRAQGIRTVHYVSPSVWAWRPGRIRKIAAATDLMLTLFPFEASFYRDHGIPAHYVGHPLADEIMLEGDPQQVARKDLGLADQAEVVALLPGSRLGEVRALGPLFADTARWLQERKPELVFAIPAATNRIRELIALVLAERAPGLNHVMVDGCSRQVMAAADVVLLASGTATLEAMLLKRPMVVAYKVAAMTAWIASRLLLISRFSLPNLLAGRELVPEFIQQSATVEKLGPAVLGWLEDAPAKARLVEAFKRLHETLRCDANRRAAAAIDELLTEGRPA